MEQRDNLIYISKPKLRSPYIICGLNGWVNGGDVSEGGTRYLISQFKGMKFAEMPIARYHVYQVPGVESLRPMFRMQDGILVESHLPKNEFYFAQNPASEHDLIFFLGTEPSLNWEEYADTVVGLAYEFKATRLYTFAGILDRSPYTKEPRTSCTCTSARVKADMEKTNVTFSSRQGPASFNLMLLSACQKRGIDGANLTVRVSYYPEFNISIDYNPKSIRAVLNRLDHLMNLELNFTEINKGVSELEAKLDAIRQQNPQFNTFIEELEKDYQEMPYPGPLDFSAHEAVKFAEDFLRENRQQGK